MVALVVTVIAMTQAWTAMAQQFSVVHRYAHMEGSPANNAGRGASPEYAAVLRAHDRRRLAAVADFPLRGDSDPSSVGYVSCLCYAPTDSSGHVPPFL